MFFILSFVFSAVWALITTRMVRDKPKTCWAMIALMLILFYFLYQ